MPSRSVTSFIILAFVAGCATSADTTSSASAAIRSESITQDFATPRALGLVEAADLADARLGRTMTALQDEVLAGHTLDTTCKRPAGGGITCSPARPGMDFVSLNGWVSGDCELLQYRSADGTRLARVRSCRVALSTSINVTLAISPSLTSDEVATSKFRTDRSWYGATTSFVSQYSRFVPSASAAGNWPYAYVRSKEEAAATPFEIDEPAEALTDFDASLYADWRAGMQLTQRQSLLNAAGLVYRQVVYHAVP